MNIAIGADHRGYAYKEFIKKHIKVKGQGINWIDVGTHNTERADYPLFAQAVVDKVKSSQADLGLLLCGSGIGMAITANRTPGIYASLAWNKEVARMSKEHTNVNVLVLPADFVGKEELQEIISTWLGAAFQQGRYQERLTMIDRF
ncbi:ribose 5-phosphate isomerase B [Candidatus Dependentiae bacterium]|nr:ribose 5-phosphate isomerase B [Candidatus Dependentiae bacterium]